MNNAFSQFGRCPSKEDCIVAVVILNWNGGEDILDCVESVFASSHRAMAVVIVDNGSVDGSSDKLRSRFPEVYFINNSQNCGFAKGSNQGMKWALNQGIQYILLLNGDARIHPDAIDELLAAVDGENDAIVACPRMYLGSTSDDPPRLWFTYGTVKLWAGLFQSPAFNQDDSPKWSVPREMEYASGCCMLIPARILKSVGMLDETFFAYCEDIDFSLRVRKAGFKLHYVPKACLWHGSRNQQKRTCTATYRYLSTRNNLWVVRKHGSKLEIFTSMCLLPIRSLFRILRIFAGADWNTTAAELRGAKDGLLSPVRPC